MIDVSCLNLALAGCSIGPESGVAQHNLYMAFTQRALPSTSLVIFSVLREISLKFYSKLNPASIHPPSTHPSWLWLENPMSQNNATKHAPTRMRTNSALACCSLQVAQAPSVENGLLPGFQALWRIGRQFCQSQWGIVWFPRPRGGSCVPAKTKNHGGQM